jgi:hypothetical protein
MITRSADPVQTNFHASLLHQLVEDLQAPYGHERSLRMTAGALLANRFLLTLTKQNIPSDPDAAVLALCRRLAMPDDLLAATAEHVGSAKFVHFGFEEDEATSLYKVYLEFPAETRTPGAPMLLHRAFKWDIANPARHVETHYVLHPHLSVAQILGRLADIYRANPAARDIAQGVVALAAARPGHEMSYLEVNEEANRRRSFDLNLYDANLYVRDLELVLSRMAEHFAIPPDSFEALYEQIKDLRFGHLAGGVHRQGQDFFNLYYGVERRPGRARAARTGWSMQTTTGQSVKRIQQTSDQDQYYNYCWWPYLPVAPTENKWRPVSLLHHSFEVAGLDEPAVKLVETIQEAIGRFRTVWGAKWLPPGPLGGARGRLAWEYYFYDYQRRQREVSITRVLDAIRPILPCDVPVNEGLAYFMFSLDVSAELLARTQPLDVVHMYIGNPGSRVSSGIAYAVTKAATALENFYFFFDAKRDLREAAEKIFCSAYVDTSKIDIDRLLWPELRDCHTICVANKQKNDTVYFSGVNVDQLLIFLKRLTYPPEIIRFVEENRGKLDHLLYDVGFDYVARGAELEFVKSGYYGVF